jgi:hypothetical protein
MFIDEIPSKQMWGTQKYSSDTATQFVTFYSCSIYNFNAFPTVQELHRQWVEQEILFEIICQMMLHNLIWIVLMKNKRLI